MDVYDHLMEEGGTRWVDAMTAARASWMQLNGKGGHCGDERDILFSLEDGGETVDGANSYSQGDAVSRGECERAKVKSRQNPRFKSRTGGKEGRRMAIKSKLLPHVGGRL